MLLRGEVYMERQPRTFESLSPNLRKKLLNNLEAKYILKGHPRPDLAASSFIARKKPKTKKQWQLIVWLTMKSIDKQRMKRGLSPVHFPKT